MSDDKPRFSGFYRYPMAERRRMIAEAAGVSLQHLCETLETGGIAAETADKFVENVLGTYALPFGVALNVLVNGREYQVPMVMEEPSVIAAASNAAKIVRASGGFLATADSPSMISQVQVYEVRHMPRARAALADASPLLLEMANRTVPGLVERGGGARSLEVRVLADDMLVVHIHVDCCDAMGANLVNTIAEGVGATIGEIAGGKVGLRILSNLCDRRCVRVACNVTPRALATETLAGEEVIAGIVNASRFAELDPYRAATHNKGIMNGVDAVCIATGNDWRAVEAGAHAYAARSGQYGPLATWRRTTDAAGQPALRGVLEMPLALGTVGGTLRVHPAARLALQLLGTESASEVAIIAGTVGLCSNLAALRALATEGIQRGHMARHARTVALAAGAVGDQVERVAQLIVAAKEITLEAAVRALRAIDVPAGEHAE